MTQDDKITLTALVMVRDNIKQLKKPYHGSFGDGVDACVERVDRMIDDFKDVFMELDDVAEVS